MGENSKTYYLGDCQKRVHVSFGQESEKSISIIWATGVHHLGEQYFLSHFLQTEDCQYTRFSKLVQLKILPNGHLKRDLKTNKVRAVQ